MLMCVGCSRLGVVSLLMCMLTSLVDMSGAHAQAQPRAHPHLAPFAIDQMRGALAWRDLKIGRRSLRTLLDHAPKLPRFTNAARKLEKISWGGFSPWRGVSEGLDLQRGISLFWSSDRDVRLLVAYRPEQEKIAFRELRALLTQGLGLPWKLTLTNSEDVISPSHQPHPPPPRGVREDYTIKPPHLVCKKRPKWLVCDTRGVREAPPPYWLTADLERGAFWFFVHNPDELPQPFVLPWESFELHADLSGDELKLSINLGAGFNPLLEMFRPQAELSEVNSWVHARSPFALKFSLDPDVIKHAGSLASQRTWIAHTQKLIEAGWGGEVMLTFDGGLDHPVLILSLTPHPWSGEKLSQTLCAMIGGRVISQVELDQEREVTRDEDLSWWMIEPDDQSLGSTTPHTAPGWRIPVLLGADHLVIGLFPPDVKRRGSGYFKPHEAPIALELERRGVSGGFVDPLIFEINSLNGGRVPIATLSAALKGLWREGGSGLTDVPEPLRGESNSLAGALARLARFESEYLVSLFAPLTEDGGLFMAMSDLASLTLQLTESISWTLYSYTQSDTGGSGLSLEITLSIL